MTTEFEISAIKENADGSATIEIEVTNEFVQQALEVFIIDAIQKGLKNALHTESST